MLEAVDDAPMLEAVDEAPMLEAEPIDHLIFTEEDN